eukprot:1192661-Prorocentrum_minimum.AAC.1
MSKGGPSTARTVCRGGGGAERSKRGSTRGELSGSLRDILVHPGTVVTLPGGQILPPDCKMQSKSKNGQIRPITGSLRSFPKC